MGDTIILRKATPADAEAIAATIAESFAQYAGRLTPESGALKETAAGIAAELANGSGAIVAEHDGTMLACVMLKPQAGDLYFGRLSVLPQARGRGLSHRLVAAVESEARRLRLPAVRLSVRLALPANQRLFASMGYREIFREAHPGFSEPTSMTMRKPLQ